jgi:hypothetical protein
MKNILFSLFLVLLIVGCNNSGEEDELTLSTSSGNINNVTVVLENDRWEGFIGEALRNTLAAPVDGLPQEEPLFSLNQMPPEAFSRDS